MWKIERRLPSMPSGMVGCACKIRRIRLIRYSLLGRSHSLANPNRPGHPGTVLSPLQQLAEDARTALDQNQKELKEIGLLISQTSAEVERLEDRNALAVN